MPVVLSLPPTMSPCCSVDTDNHIMAMGMAWTLEPGCERVILCKVCELFQLGKHIFKLMELCVILCTPPVPVIYSSCHFLSLPPRTPTPSPFLPINALAP